MCCLLHLSPVCTHQFTTHIKYTYVYTVDLFVFQFYFIYWPILDISRQRHKWRIDIITCRHWHTLTNWGRVTHNIWVGKLSLVQIWHVACSTPRHYLNQCWNIVNCVYGNKLQWNLKYIQCTLIRTNKMLSSIYAMHWLHTPYKTVIDSLWPGQNSCMYYSSVVSYGATRPRELIQKYPFKYVVWKMATILSRPQCVNSLWPSGSSMLTTFMFPELKLAQQVLKPRQIDRRSPRNTFQCILLIFLLMFLLMYFLCNEMCSHSVPGGPIVIMLSDSGAGQATMDKLNRSWPSSLMQVCVTEIQHGDQ